MLRDEKPHKDETDAVMTTVTPTRHKGETKEEKQARKQLVKQHNKVRPDVCRRPSLTSEVLLLVRCPDFRGLNVCTLIQMGPWTSVLIIKGVLISEVS